jgi:hypothetical protein
MQRFFCLSCQTGKVKTKMKLLLYITTASVMLTAFGCKKELHKTAEIIRGCTGTYLRIDGKNYKVCNLEKVASFTNGTTVEASFKKISGCKGSGNFPVTCYMGYDFDSWIEVKRIK